jgi:hypothetical protein
MIGRLLNRLFRFEAISRRGDVYLHRWTLIGPERGPKVMLHHFLRGDVDPEPHDHPWIFWTFILWGGYYEQTWTAEGKALLTWYGPGSLLRRPAAWAHRVVIPEGKEAWTLVLTGRKVRHWGFWCPLGWIPWRQHLARFEATGSGCG